MYKKDYQNISNNILKTPNDHLLLPHYGREHSKTRDLTTDTSMEIPS